MEVEGMTTKDDRTELAVKMIVSSFPFTLVGRLIQRSACFDLQRFWIAVVFGTQVYLSRSRFVTFVPLSESEIPDCVKSMHCEVPEEPAVRVLCLRSASTTLYERNPTIFACSGERISFVVESRLNFQS